MGEPSPDRAEQRLGPAMRVWKSKPLGMARRGILRGSAIGLTGTGVASAAAAPADGRIGAPVCVAALRC